MTAFEGKGQVAALEGALAVNLNHLRFIFRQMQQRLRLRAAHDRGVVHLPAFHNYRQFIRIGDAGMLDSLFHTV
ncbi:MAG: hypothetical protein J7L66_00225, partial [Anaerolineaceae bacterium]|nr:hypothetical protein [Anaerolineaceae bacterium]